MISMVVEDFRGRDPKAVYRRFGDKGCRTVYGSMAAGSPPT
jgi:hypothetical protein